MLSILIEHLTLLCTIIMEFLFALTFWEYYQLGILLFIHRTTTFQSSL